mgnify:CR=1 FL=1
MMVTTATMPATTKITTGDNDDDGDDHATDSDGNDRDNDDDNVEDGTNGEYDGDNKHGLLASQEHGAFEVVADPIAVNVGAVSFHECVMQDSVVEGHSATFR